MSCGVNTRFDDPVDAPNRPGNGLSVASDGRTAATAAAAAAATNGDADEG